MNGDEYLTVAEVAVRLKLSPKTIRNRMSAGTLPRGVVWFRPPGMGPRFRWLALVGWLEHAKPPAASTGWRGRRVVPREGRAFAGLYNPETRLWRRREAARLRDVEGLPWREIGERLGVTPSRAWELAGLGRDNAAEKKGGA